LILKISVVKGCKCGAEVAESVDFSWNGCAENEKALLAAAGVLSQQGRCGPCRIREFDERQLARKAAISKMTREEKEARVKDIAAVYGITPEAP